MENKNTYILDLLKLEDDELVSDKSYSFFRFKDAIARAIRHCQLSETNVSKISNFKHPFGKGSPYVKIFGSNLGVRIITGFEPARNMFNSFMESDGLCNTGLDNYYADLQYNVEVNNITGRPLVTQAFQFPQNIGQENIVPVPENFDFFNSNTISYGFSTENINYIFNLDSYNQENVNKKAIEEEKYKKKQEEKKQQEDMIVKKPAKRQIDLE